MLDLLELKENIKILEVGSGSGYVLALINQISKNSKIYSIERIKELVEKSRKILDDDIVVVCGDGSKGLKKHAPFDRILVSASAEEIPSKLIEQLKIKGVLVCPVQNSIFQIKKTKEGVVKKEFPGFVFVPLIEN